MSWKPCVRSERACSAFALVLITAGCCSAAGPFQCPATLEQPPHRLSMITFYDGPPEEKASLVYDTLKKSAGQEIATWQFSPDRKNWLTCSDEGTTATVKRALPPSVRTCSVTYHARDKVAGLPAIETMACR